LEIFYAFEEQKRWKLYIKTFIKIFTFRLQLEKNMKLYKIPEKKYQGFYNPISHKNVMEYVPKYNIFVQSKQKY